jgi:Zn-dependent protease
MYILSLLQQPVNTEQKILFFVFFIVAMLIGITFHEFAHAWTANRLGDPTPKLTGRLSLNPLKHLDLVGTIFLFLVGIGWGKPVMFNPANFKEPKKAILLTSFSGAIMNLLIAFIFSIPYRLNVYLHLGLQGTLIFAFFDVVVIINLLLAAFNIIPIPPLDGSKILYLFLGGEQIYVFEKFGPIILYGLIFLSLFTNFNFLGNIISAILNWLLYLVRVFPAKPF